MSERSLNPPVRPGDVVLDVGCAFPPRGIKFRLALANGAQ